MKQFINLIDYLEVIIMTNRELLEFTLKVNIGTCNEIYTKMDRKPKDDYESSEEDILLIKTFNTLVSMNQAILDMLYPERADMNLPNAKHLALTKHGEVVEVEVQE
tara:strand:- start:219 stop:536 length:318 start_codon:yes stop_codon:yes gene_type:complete